MHIIRVPLLTYPKSVKNVTFFRYLLDMFQIHSTSLQPTGLTSPGYGTDLERSPKASRLYSAPFPPKKMPTSNTNVRTASRENSSAPNSAGRGVQKVKKMEKKRN